MKRGGQRRRGAVKLALAAALLAAGGLLDPGSAEPSNTAALAPGLAGPAHVAALSPADQAVVELLSGIDFVPNRGALDDTLGQAAPSELIAIARGGDPAMNDAGLRLRAYRALALYPGPDTESALQDAVMEHGQKSTGVDTLYLRAAMESLAVVAGADAVDTLSPMLDHPSRDVRAAAALALGATGSQSAIAPLRARLTVETVQQVRLALAQALRDLGATGLVGG